MRFFARHTFNGVNILRFCCSCKGFFWRAATHKHTHTLVYRHLSALFCILIWSSCNMPQDIKQHTPFLVFFVCSPFALCPYIYHTIPHTPTSICTCIQGVGNVLFFVSSDSVPFNVLPGAGCGVSDTNCVYPLGLVRPFLLFLFQSRFVTLLPLLVFRYGQTAAISYFFGSFFAFGKSKFMVSWLPSMSAVNVSIDLVAFSLLCNLCCSLQHFFSRPWALLHFFFIHSSSWFHFN